MGVYMCVYMLSLFRDQRTMSGLRIKTDSVLCACDVNTCVAKRTWNAGIEYVTEEHPALRGMDSWWTLFNLYALFTRMPGESYSRLLSRVFVAMVARRLSTDYQPSRDLST